MVAAGYALRLTRPTETTETRKAIVPVPRLTVWYNTRCPVCNGGIDWQRSKLVAAVRAGEIAFKDINVEPAALATYGATLDDVRRRLHATDAQGRLIVGADVAIAIWRARARWRQ